MYGTTADATTYHAARGNAAWAALTVAEMSSALQRGSDYVDRNFRNRFPGQRAGGSTQFEEWPRTGATYRTGEAIDSATVPTAVQYAAYEAALIEAASPGSLLPTFSEDSRPTEYKAGSVAVRYQSQVRQSASYVPLNRGAVPFELAQGDTRAAVVATNIEGLLSGILRAAIVPGGVTV